MKSIVILPVFLLLALLAAAQTIVPNMPIDSVLRKKIDLAISEIDSLSVRCDTIANYPFEKYRPLNLFESLYKDSEKHVRKYHYKEYCADGASEYITINAYYDEDGELVYLSYVSGNHCTDSSEIYYVDRKQLIDFRADYDCGCCDDEPGFTQEEVDNKRPAVGSIFAKTIIDECDITNYLTVDALLIMIKSKEHKERTSDRFEYLNQ